MKGNGSLAQEAVAAQANFAKELRKSHGLAAKQYRQEATDFAKNRNSTGTGAPQQKSKVAKKKQTHVQKEKTAKEEEPKQGERTLRTPGDIYGCGHSGLLELLPLERKYLQAYVKEGGWLYATPCYDCAKKEGGSDNRVLNVSDLLKVKGRGGLGFYCNCGPVSHNMDHEEEPERKKQWACNMVLCMDCYNRRKEGTGDGNKRARRAKKKD
jgi:hypothetical protein